MDHAESVLNHGSVAGGPGDRKGSGDVGYVVDHIVPLKRRWADNPSNIQWQTKGETKTMDRWE
jgi:hypothetical protein